MKISTQYDRAIVEAAGIDASQYSDAEISKFAHDLVRHVEVVSRAAEISLRQRGVSVITELSADPHMRTRIHFQILKECGQAPLKLK